MRLEKVMGLLELARALAGSAEGLTLDEMAEFASVDRRTAERIAQDEFALLLGAERERALDVTVIWDEDQAEIVRVLDLAPLRAGRAADLRQRNIYAAARQRAATRFAPAYAPEAVAA